MWYICNIIILKCNQYLKYYENIAYSFFLVFEIRYVHTLTTFSIQGSHIKCSIAMSGEGPPYWTEEFQIIQPRPLVLRRGHRGSKKLYGLSFLSHEAKQWQNRDRNPNYLTPGFKTQHHSLLAVSLRANFLTSLSFSFLFYKTEVMWYSQKLC